MKTARIRPVGAIRPDVGIYQRTAKQGAEKQNQEILVDENCRSCGFSARNSNSYLSG